VHGWADIVVGMLLSFVKGHSIKMRWKGSSDDLPSSCSNCPTTRPELRRSRQLGSRANVCAQSIQFYLASPGLQARDMHEQGLLISQLQPCRALTGSEMLALNVWCEYISLSSIAPADTSHHANPG
jgi:hypothetical protein